MSSSFDFLEHELRSDLLFERGVVGQKSRLRRVDGNPTLPGQPWIDMTTDDLVPFFRKSLLVEALDKVAPYLWLVRSCSTYIVERQGMTGTDHHSVV
jgi:hypothetical protein